MDVDEAVETMILGFKDRSMYEYERSRASVDDLKAFLRPGAGGDREGDVCGKLNCNLN